MDLHRRGNKEKEGRALASSEPSVVYISLYAKMMRNWRKREKKRT